jgi:hypothetical protein
MWEYIVLGQIPGTNLQIGFYTFVMALMALAIHGVRLNFRQVHLHKQKSQRLAEKLVAESILRPDPEPVQMKLL